MARTPECGIGVAAKRGARLLLPPDTRRCALDAGVNTRPLRARHDELQTVDSPPALLKDGAVIRDGVDPVIDECRRLADTETWQIFLTDPDGARVELAFRGSDIRAPGRGPSSFTTKHAVRRVAP